ncbi:hypothetical protein Tco_0363571 [Tanacetum coccineum]
MLRSRFRHGWYGGAIVCCTARVLELDTHSSSEADPSKSSPPSIYSSRARTLRCVVEAYLCLKVGTIILPSLVPSRADLLPPHKRFRDSIFTRWIVVDADIDMGGRWLWMDLVDVVEDRGQVQAFGAVEEA